MLECCCADFGTSAARKCGQKRGVEVDRMQRSVGCDDEVLGFQIAVRPIVRYQLQGQPVERFGESLQAFRVALSGSLCDGRMERVALDPVVQHHVDPFSAFGGGVQIEFLGQELFAVDFSCMGCRTEVAAQGVYFAVVPDAEHRGAVARGVERASRLIAAQDRIAQGAGQTVGVVEGQQILAEGKQGEIGNAGFYRLCRVSAKRGALLVEAWAPGLRNKKGKRKNFTGLTFRLRPLCGAWFCVRRFLFSGSCSARRGRRSRSRRHDRIRRRTRGRRRTNRTSSGLGGLRASRRAP